MFFYFLVIDRPLHFFFPRKEETKMEEMPLAASFLEDLQELSFDDLVELLEDRRILNQGYRVCDFAVGTLTTFHHFDILRALGRKNLPARKWVVNERVFTLYPDLQEKDLERLITFLKEEIYPFTNQGLLSRIQANIKDKELLTYFCHTPEFILLEKLFLHHGISISKGNLLSMICEGGWERFEKYYLSQEEAVDFSQDMVRKFLIEYIENGSKTAAYLLLVIDSEYAIKYLSDDHIVCILDLLDVKTVEANDFVNQLITSPRADKVRRGAWHWLNQHPSGQVEEMAAFTDKQLRPLFRDSPPASPSPSTHIVQPGESLWLIARRYQISVHLLIEVNHLQSTIIKPGKTLKIPLN
ncbi:MAG: LysM peptidoglycan-binding domain-containing protein [Chlamydiales bacterium]